MFWNKIVARFVRYGARPKRIYNKVGKRKTDRECTQLRAEKQSGELYLEPRGYLLVRCVIRINR